MTVNLEALRPSFSEPVATNNDDGEVVFTDHMSKFIDDLISGIDTLTADLTALEEQVAIEDWHEVGAAGEPAFKNSWVSFDAGRALKYRIDGDHLEIEGSIKSGTSAGAVITTITDADSQPNANRFSVCATGGGPAGTGNLFLATNGDLRFIAGGNTAFSDCSARFYLG